ncbi:cyclin N-terminal domain-containing protein 1-like [Anticarsia gemmatalis]|uniref:cyclin N-terminal domain-containing protein 1-like n=1 Tax=Anticarsia gemmatalis TaxID=129554 RepID=UPI003F768DFA
MCSEMGSNLLPAYLTDWIEALIQEYEDEAKEEARWPILLLQAPGRKLIWHLCSTLGVSSKGVPGSACRLMERYLSRHIQNYLQDLSDNDEWELYRSSLASRYYLLAVSCIQLAAKMTDLTALLTTSLVRSTLLREGVVHSQAEIVHMEFHVYHTLDFRIPLWTSLEAAEFLAIRVGIRSPSILEAVALITNLSEFNRDLLELHMRCWTEVCNTPGSSSSSTGRSTLRTLHVCAGGVCAAARFMRASVDLTRALAALTRTTPSHIKAISDTILNHIIPEK